MAQVTDFSGIKQLMQPLEESGILVKRTDEEVSLTLINIEAMLAMYCVTYFIIC